MVFAGLYYKKCWYSTQALAQAVVFVSKFVATEQSRRAEENGPSDL